MLFQKMILSCPNATQECCLKRHTEIRERAINGPDLCWLRHVAHISKRYKENIIDLLDETLCIGAGCGQISRRDIARRGGSVAYCRRRRGWTIPHPRESACEGTVHARHQVLYIHSHFFFCLIVRCAVVLTLCRLNETRGWEQLSCRV